MSEMFARTDAIVAALVSVPRLVAALRDMITPTFQADAGDVRVSGGREKATMPIHATAFDELDELWAVMWELLDEVIEARPGLFCFHQLARIARVRSLQQLAVCPTPDTVRGFRTADTRTQDHQIQFVGQCLLHARSVLGIDSRFADSVPEFCERVDRLTGMTGVKIFQRYSNKGCLLCGQFAVRTVWDSEMRAVYVCDNCEHEER